MAYIPVELRKHKKHKLSVGDKVWVGNSHARIEALLDIADGAIYLDHPIPNNDSGTQYWNEDAVICHTKHHVGQYYAGY